MSPRKPRRLRRWLVAIGLGLVLLVGTGVVVLRVKFNGPALAEQIETMLNRRMRGRIDVGSIEWPAGGLTTVVTGGWMPVTIRNVTVWDRRADERTPDCFDDKVPPPPRKVIETPQLTAEVDVHALMFGRHDLVFRNVVVHGGHVRLEQIKEPYPLHAYDKTIVSLVAAFYPCMKPGYFAGFYASAPPPVFDLRDIEVRDLDLDLFIGPDETVPYDAAGGPFYTATLSVTDVNAKGGFLYMDPTDPLVSRMYFSLAPKAGPGWLRIRDAGVKPRGSFLPSWMMYEDDQHAPEYNIELAKVDIRRLAQLPTEWPRTGVANSLRIDGTLYTTAGGEIAISGDLVDWWDRQFDGKWELAVTGTNLGETLHRFILPPLGGDKVGAEIYLSGPFIALPKLDFTVSGLRYDVAFEDPMRPVLRLELDTLHGWVDFVNETGSLDKTIATATCVRGSPDRCGKPPKGGDIPGKIELSAHFGLPLNLNAQLDITQPLDLGPWLPPKARTSFGRYLRGRMRAEGKSDTQLSLADIDLVLGRSRTDRATRIHGGKIYTADGFEKIELEKLRVDAGKTNVTINGGVTLTEGKESFGFELHGKSSDLAVWLRRLGAPPIARSAENLKANVSGARVDGELVLRSAEASGRLRGVPTVDQVDVVARLESDLLFLDSVSTPGLGGTLHGGGSIRIKGTPYIENLDLEGSGLDLAKLPGNNGAITGTVRSAKLRARGSLRGRFDMFDWLGLTSGYVVSDNVTVLGDRYNDAALCINYGDDELCRRPGVQVETGDLQACDQAKKGGTCIVGRASRKDGGALDITLASPARRGKRSPPLSGTLQVADAPIEVVTRMLGKSDAPFGGHVSAGLRFGGTRSAPTVEGTVALLRAWVLDAMIGDTTLAVAPDPENPRVVVISGKLLHDRLDVLARVGTEAPYPVDLTIAGRRVELDAITGDLAAYLPISEPVRAWATGTVSLHAELAGKSEPIAWIELDELGAIVDHRDPDGRAVPLRVNALPGEDGRKAVSIRATPSSVAFKCRGERLETVDCPVRLATPAGVITVAGEVTPSRLALTANGTLDLRLIAPLVDVYFDDVSGSAVVAANLAGTPEKPEPSASIQLQNVRVRPVGQETVVRVPTGLIQIANNSLGFTDVKVRVDDTYLGEKAELALRGNVSLEGFRPTSWAVEVDGQLAGKMLLAAAPHVISQASGVAEIEFFTLSGKGKIPDVEARVKFNAKQPLILTMRGLRRELEFNGGSVEVSSGKASESYDITLDKLSGKIDGDGSLRNITGELQVADGTIATADVRLDAEGIPFNVPRTLDLVLNIDGLHVERRSKFSNWELTGRRVELVTGRYIRRFAWDQVLRPDVAAGPTTPIWIEYPELGAAQLDLTIDIREFKVANNVADISMTGSSLRLTGTPRDPRIDGQIRVQNGTFKVPGTAPKFSRTEGTISFARHQRFPAQTPNVDIHSEADYRDSTGQDHLITMHLSGTLSDLTYDLYTSSGFNKQQTWALIISGRTQDQVNKSLGADPIGGDPTRPISTNSGGVADQVIRDIAGDTISLLVEDQLKSVSKLDVARPFVSIGAWGFHGEKKLFENVNVVGDYEQTTRGRSVNIRGELHTPIKGANVQGGYQNKQFNDNSEEDQSDFSVKLVYRFFIQ